ncbi:hypothetical protein VTK26DRAFT_620 [Humicola hyalothermophila]
MDYFNATIKDGKLVKTRRGLQVSRQKFNGLSFVNTSSQDADGPSGLLPPPGAPNSLRNPIKFVEEVGGRQKGKLENRTEDGDGQGGFEVAQATKRRRRGTRKGHPPTTASAGTSSQPSPTTAQGIPSQPQRAHCGCEGTFVESPASGLPTLLTPAAFLSSEDNRTLFERCLDHAARSSYPYENLLTYNPIRRDDFTFVPSPGPMKPAYIVRSCVVASRQQSSTRSRIRNASLIIPPVYVPSDHWASTSR